MPTCAHLSKAGQDISSLSSEPSLLPADRGQQSHTAGGVSACGRRPQPTKRDAAGQRGALRLAPGGRVTLQDAVVQQVPGAGVGEGGALELGRVYLMDEAGGGKHKRMRLC